MRFGDFGGERKFRGYQAEVPEIPIFGQIWIYATNCTNNTNKGAEKWMENDGFEGGNGGIDG
jgi:hypothetical protein